MAPGYVNHLIVPVNKVPTLKSDALPSFLQLPNLHILPMVPLSEDTVDDQPP